MPAIEFSAKSQAEALKTAAVKLGVSEGLVKLTVLEETKGLFGKTTLRVRAEAAEASEAPTPKDAPKETKAKGGRAPRKETPTPVVDAVETPAEVEEEAPAKPGRGRKTTKAAPPKPVDDTVSEVPESEESVSDVVATAEDGEKLAAVVRELLDASGLDIQVKVGSVSGRYVNISLDGKDSSYIVGKHGEVLNALQHLANIVSNRRHNNGIRATIECNDYRKRREDALTALAGKIAAEVKSRGEEAVLDALPAFERRIVHRALQEIDGITTYSEGEEPNRRVVIAPAE